MIDTYFEAVRNSGQQLLEKAAALAWKRGVELAPTLTRSRGKSVADVIVRWTRNSRRTSIVLGTYGRRGLKRVLMGSDVERRFARREYRCCWSEARIVPLANRVQPIGDGRRSAA